MTTRIIQKTEAFVAGLFRDRLPSWVRYHTPEHTREVVEAGLEIGRAMELSDEELEVVVLAAWLHDAGYVDGGEGHEERSAAVAGEFLAREGYPPERIPLVQGCIMATRIPQQPSTALERIVCDADICYIGSDGFRPRSDALREELELRSGERLNEVAWIRKNIEFVERCRFHTGFARRRFGPMREKNLADLRVRLEAAMAGQG